MKNKKSIYILLPAVLLIWGMVVYNFIGWSPAGTPETFTPDAIATQPVAIPKRDTTLIDVRYRDPFLGKMYSAPKAPADAPKRKEKAKETLLWPAIKYKGVVSDNDNKRKVYMVVINGQTYLMHEKETQQEIILYKGDRQSVTLQYKGKKDTYLIEK